MSNITKTCEDVSMDRMTCYCWVKIEKFQREMDEGVETHDDLVFQRILKSSLESDKEMLKFWAKTLF